MVLALILILLAIVLGLGGFLIAGLKWLLIVAVVLFIVGAISGARNRRQL